MKTTASIFAIILVLLSGVPLIASPGALNINYASAKYAPANTQTQANANDCDNGTNCAINSPQTQGDGSASSPTNAQIAGIGDEAAVDGAPPTTFPPDAFIIVTKHVICPQGFVCPSAKDSLILVLNHDLSRKQIVFISPDEFRGSETGTTVRVSFHDPDPEPGPPGAEYTVLEFPLAPTPEGLVLHKTHQGKCIGIGIDFRETILPGETNTCTFTNEYRVAPTTP